MVRIQHIFFGQKILICVIFDPCCCAFTRKRGTFVGESEISGATSFDSQENGGHSVLVQLSSVCRRVVSVGGEPVERGI